MTTIDDVTRRLLGYGTIEDVPCDEEGVSVILATYPNGTAVAYHYADSAERPHCVGRARRDLKTAGVEEVRWEIPSS